MVKIKKIYSIVIVLFILFSLSSCLLGTSYVDVDGKYDGLSIGFNYEDERYINDVVGAVRSNQTEFDINNVTLECFYGWYMNPPDHYYKNGVFEPVCVGLYFNTLRIPIRFEFEDYQNIDGMILLKDISIEEFSTEAYNITNSPKKGITFEQKELFTIPKEYFVNPRGGMVGFMVANIGWDPKNNVYVSRGRDFTFIKYSFIDEETVLLYK